MIDLHTHTTASDGHCSPLLLVERAAAAGLTTIAVTDHDTTAATAEVAALCAARGMRAVDGIEITAIDDGRDVHVLGYFVDRTDAALLAFLARQRDARIERVRAIAASLSELGMPIDVRELLEGPQARAGRSVGRPQVARAMMAAGHVSGVTEAFEKWLGSGRPAFVPRTGAAASAVIALIHGAGGLASVAHPGQTRIDSRIARLRDAGLDALEVYHPDHSPEDRERYLRMAADLDLLVTGGSDYHGDPEHGIELGSIGLPLEAWARLARRIEQLTK
jgi:predicted metal-dependent phosphoesterase TrpH